MKQTKQAPESQFWGIIPAAGAGNRFSSSNARPKQYHYLHGQRTILEFSVECLLRVKDIVKVIVALRQTDVYWQDLELATNPRIDTTLGGVNRAASVLNALQCMETYAREDDWVLVHDAVRPCVPVDCVANLIEAMRESDHKVGGILALPITDQLHYGTDDMLATPYEGVAGSQLWRAQTPQIFRYSLLRTALEHADKHNALADMRDEASAILRAGHSPQIVMGSPENIKITYAADLNHCQGMLSVLDRPN